MNYHIKWTCVPDTWIIHGSNRRDCVRRVDFNQKEIIRYFTIGRKIFIVCYIRKYLDMSSEEDLY